MDHTANRSRPAANRAAESSSRRDETSVAQPSVNRAEADTLLDAALDLAASGWDVFPCHPTGPRAKAPFTSHGHLDATRDPRLIRAWWDRWPTAMIGAPVPAPLLVLDIDPRNGGSYEALTAKLGPLPATLTTWSGRGDGGRHLYFQTTWSKVSARNLPPGVDLKPGGRGYCIMPPSRHPEGGTYYWEHQEPAPLPYEALMVLTEPSRPPRRPTLTHLTPPSYWRGLTATVAGAPEGTRHMALLWAACRAVEQGAPTEVVDQLVETAIAAGLPAKEAERVRADAEKLAVQP
jgi:hypothetical protein